LHNGAQADGPKGGWGCCVDLGCGTGLLGPLLRPQVHSLDGVDLSGKMVEKLAERGATIACLSGTS
jgi:predicted TPR repeat methyltransferase